MLCFKIVAVKVLCNCVMIAPNALEGMMNSTLGPTLSATPRPTVME